MTCNLGEMHYCVLYWTPLGLILKIKNLYLSLGCFLRGTFLGFAIFFYETLFGRNALLYKFFWTLCIIFEIEKVDTFSSIVFRRGTFMALSFLSMTHCLGDRVGRIVRWTDNWLHMCVYIYIYIYID
jgi:hypothetical protein